MMAGTPPLQQGRRQLKDKASKRAQAAPSSASGGQACASQEQLPIEVWHVRHLRSSHLIPADAGAAGPAAAPAPPCRPHGAPPVLARHVTGKGAEEFALNYAENKANLAGPVSFLSPIGRGWPKPGAGLPWA